MLGFIEKHVGIPRSEMYRAQLSGDVALKVEAAEGIACYLDDVIDDMTHGIEPEDMDPVTTQKRRDQTTGKVRDISTLCILHQLLGHLVKCGLEPLLDARLLPQQHASIPHHGQHKLVSQTKRYLCSKSLGIKYARKTDVVHAYASIHYSKVAEILAEEIPSAKWILATVKYLGTLAPNGVLIIGGYLDAWLFNLAMSYAMRYVLSLGKTRRGKFIPWARRIESQMDDFVLLGTSVRDLDRAVKALGIWMQDTFDAKIRITTGLISLLPIKDERQRKTETKPSKRGCPNIDVAGYKIQRSHVTIRASTFLRLRRQYLRAWREYMQTGTLRVQRARSLIAYYGIIKAANSRGFEERYHVIRLVTAAKRVARFYGYLDNKRRMERMLKYLSITDEDRYNQWRYYAKSC